MSEKQSASGEWPRGRKAAEWASLGVSATLVLGVASYLCYEVWRPHSEIIPVTVRPLPGEAGEVPGGYVLPVEVHNGGSNTLHHLKVRVSHRAPGGKDEEQEFTVDYLGERATRRVYVYFDRDPRPLSVTATPLNYTTD